MCMMTARSVAGPPSNSHQSLVSSASGLANGWLFAKSVGEISVVGRAVVGKIAIERMAVVAPRKREVARIFAVFPAGGTTDSVNRR